MASAALSENIAKLALASQRSNEREDTSPAMTRAICSLMSFA